MKTKGIQRVIILVAMLISMAGMQGCKDLFHNPLEDKETGEDITLLLLDINFFDTRFTFQFNDYITGEAVETEEITFKIDGDIGTSLVGIDGEYNEIITTSSGIVELFLDPNITPTTDNPITFDVVAIGETYFNLPTTVEVTETGTYNVTVDMLSIGAGFSSNVEEQEDILKSTSLLQELDLPYDLASTPTDGFSSIPIDNYVNSGISTHAYIYAKNSSLIEVVRINLLGLTNPNADPKCNLQVGVNTPPDPQLVLDYGMTRYPIPGNDVLRKDVDINKKGDAFSINTSYSYLERCTDGVRIKINFGEGSSSLGGKFKYTITFDNSDIKYSGYVQGSKEELSKGIKLSKAVYYPKDNPNGTITISDNALYTVSAAQNFDSPCKTHEFTATVRTGLVEYKLISQYTCPDNRTAALTISTSNFRYRISGSTGAWSETSVVEGIATLYMKSNTEYDFEAFIKDRWERFTITNNPEGLQEFLNEQDQQNNEYTIKKLEITIGNPIVIELKVDLDSDLCDRIG